MYKISIIIPAHNEGKYIRECVDSIMNQTMNFEDMELIMIEDASEDNTYEIMKEYAEKYTNCIALRRNEKSGSAGKPRNEALNYVSGKYIMFIDADDTYVKDACEVMYDTIENTNSDFVTANAMNVKEDGKTEIRVFMDEKNYENQILTMEKLKKDVLPMSCSVCFKIFSTNFVKNNNLRFLEGVPAEDSYFSYSALMKAKKAYFINKVIYNYRKRFSENNLSTSTNFSKEYFEKINSSYNAIYKRFKENGYIECYKLYYINSMCYLLFNLMISNKLSNEDVIEIMGFLAWFFKILDELSIDLTKVKENREIIGLIECIKDNKLEEALNIFKNIRANFEKNTDIEIREMKIKLKNELILI